MTVDSAVTAIAHPNIALVKYWGKRDEEYILPHTDSLSVTLDIYPTTTTVRRDTALDRDQVTVNRAPATGEMLTRIRTFLDLVRGMSGRAEYLRVDTTNTVPTGAGLASSASGFAALAMAAAVAYGLDLNPTGLSRLARRGSGSACRSIFGGFALWHAGTGIGEEGDLSSYADPIDAGALDLALVVAVVDAAPKEISSRAAMRRTIETSPLYAPWAESSHQDLADMRAAITRGDLDAVGEIAERNALGMHATMLAARPAVRYLSPASLRVLDCVGQLRRTGIGAFATMDAGPNVKVLCRGGHAERVADALRSLSDTRSVITARPGPGARLLDGDSR